MSQRLKNENMLHISVVVLLCLVIPAMAWGQKKGGGGGGHSAPAARPAAHPSGGGGGHSSARPAQTHNAPAHNAPSHSAQTHNAPSHNAPSHNAPSHNAPSHNAPSHNAQTHNAPSHGPTGGHTAAGHGPTGGHTAAGGHGPAGGHAPGRGPAGGHTAAAGHGPAGGHGGNAHAPRGVRNVGLKNGGRASFRSNGQVRSINRGGQHIEHGMHGGRAASHDFGHGHVVFAGRHGGYVQHAYMVRGGRSFYSRTFVVGGVVHVGLYRGFFWGGHPYYGWYPGFWFHPAFYGWGFQPWGVPVVWGIGAWGWGGPWWGFYSGWWTPYPVYAAPYFWLTDYLIAANLQAAYAAAHEPPPAGEPAPAADDSASTDTAASTTASAPVTLSPEVKQAIAEEVKAQLAAQQAQAAAGASTTAAASTSTTTTTASATPPPALDPANRTFVVDTAVTAVASDGTECGLTSGDVVTRLTDTPDATDNTVNASVSATKKGDCASGATVAVKVDDLQEMYNHFADSLSNGMKEMAKKQGTNGMPKAPDTGTTASDVPEPKADPDAAKAIQDENAEADKTEADVKAEAAAGGGL